MKQILMAILVCAVALQTTAWAEDSKARAIMERAEARDDGDRSITTTEMILIDKQGGKRVRKLKRFSHDVGEDVENIIFFLHPADVKDTGFLSYDFEEGAKDDDQWLYLPALKKVKRIASSDKSGSFMGSDFTYSDMTQRDLNDYEFKLLKEMKVGDEAVWVIESLPKEKRVIDETGYTKSILFIRQDNDVLIRAIHYVKEGKKLKFLDVKKLEMLDGIWTPTETHMTTKKGKKTLHKTILRQHNTKYNQSMDASLFNVRTLERGL